MHIGGNLASVLSLNISVVDPSWIINPEPGGQLFTDPVRIWILPGHCFGK
jgi:hypothetical protein